MENLWVLTLAGFAVSIVSALESRVQVIASFCSFFGEGCRKTEDFKRRIEEELKTAVSPTAAPSPKG
jgi:hypothetical protein